jgi:hypothetical protein
LVPIIDTFRQRPRLRRLDRRPGRASTYLSAVAAERAAKIGAVRKQIHPAPGNIRPVSRDLRWIAKPQISAKLPAIQSEVDPVASNVPDVGANVRPSELATKNHSTGKAHSAATEAAAKATWGGHSAEARSAKAALEAARKPPVAPKGRGFGRNQDRTQDGRDGENDHLLASHSVPLS